MFDNNVYYKFYLYNVLHKYYLKSVSSSVNAIHFTALFDKSFFDRYLKIVIVFKQCPRSVFGTSNTLVGIVSSKKSFFF